MGLFNKVVSAGSSALNSDAGKLLQAAAVDRAASEINKYTDWGQGADTQSPTAQLQPPTQPAAAASTASIMDKPWFWPAVGIAAVALILFGSKLFGGKKRRK